MKKLLQAISFLALAGILFPAILYLMGMMEKPAMSSVMLGATILWFTTVPLWTGKQSEESR